MLPPNPPGFDVNSKKRSVWVSKWINPTWINPAKLTKFTENDMRLSTTSTHTHPQTCTQIIFKLVQQGAYSWILCVMCSWLIQSSSKFAKKKKLIIIKFNLKMWGRMAWKETCILSLTWRFKKYSDLVFALLNRNPGLEWTKMENLDSWPCKNN